MTTAALAVFLSACTTEIPIIAIQMADDDGSNPSSIEESEIREWLEVANDHWDAQDLEFTFSDNDLIQIKSTRLNTKPQDANDPQWELYRLTANYLVTLTPANKIPVIFRARGNTSWSGIPGHTNYISMPAYKNACIGKQNKNKECEPDESLLSHALGHYFGLGHTFGSAGCSAANQENTDGDSTTMTMNSLAPVTDTSSDPGIGCLSEEQIESQDRTVTLTSGERFRPPWRNLMSGYPTTRNRLSDDQSEIVEEVLITQAWRKRLHED